MGGKSEGRLSLKQVGVSFGITGAVLSLLCAALVWLSPDSAAWLFRSIVHSGISMTAGSVSIVSALTGAVASFALGAVLGLVFVPVYNYCKEHCK